MAKLTHEDILAYLEEATILELNDLVKAIEEKIEVIRNYQKPETKTKKTK